MLNPAAVHPSPGRREASPLQVLKVLAPPVTLIHIGAGTGQGALYEWHTWGVAQAHVVYAHLERLAWAQKVASTNPSWQVRSTSLAVTEGPITYHQANNPAEDGFIPAQKLSAMWPNLRFASQEQRAGNRNAAGAHRRSHHSPRLDLAACRLPSCMASSVGRTAALLHCTVVAVRALVQPVACLTAGVALSEIEAMLQRHGFKFVVTIESCQPAIGHALLVLGWQAVLELGSQNVGPQTHLTIRLQGSIATLQVHSDQLAQERGNLVAVRAQLTSAVAEMTAQLEAEIQGKAEAMIARHAAINTSLEATAQRDTSATDRNPARAVKEEHARVATQRHQSLTAASRKSATCGSTYNNSKPTRSKPTSCRTCSKKK